LLKDFGFAPFARFLGPRVCPNVISVLAFVFGLGCALALVPGLNVVALTLWIVNRLLDGLDGTQARVHGLGGVSRAVDCCGLRAVVERGEHRAAYGFGSAR
jgi:hypothetical protein